MDLDSVYENNEDTENDMYVEDSEDTTSRECVERQWGANVWRMMFYALLLAISVFNFTSVITFVPTESMAKSIEPNDILYASKLPYLLEDPERFDIVVFKYPLNGDTLFIKRVIGLPGEHITITNGHIYVNGAGPLVETYLPETWTKYNDDYEFDVPDDAYLMLGDNRNNSFDARFWREEALAEHKSSSVFDSEKYAYVKRSDIIGKALTKISPTFEALK